MKTEKKTKNYLLSERYELRGFVTQDVLLGGKVIGRVAKDWYYGGWRVEGEPFAKFKTRAVAAQFVVMKQEKGIPTAAITQLF